MSPICLPPSSLTKSSALGQGATAEIFAAWLGPPKGSVSPDCPKRVAVKIYKEGCERDFQRELNALRHLSLYDESLPGTLSLFGETSVDGRQALAMELCRCDLMTLLQSCNAGLPLDVARVYTLQMWYSQLRGTRKPRFGARLDFLSRLAAAASLYFLSSFS